jgi:hypothetical protein
VPARLSPLEGARHVTKKQMLAECRRLAPDFKMTLETVQGSGPCVVARCTIDGKVHELAHALGAWGRARVETSVLGGCLGSLRKTKTAA